MNTTEQLSERARFKQIMQYGLGAGCENLALHLAGQTTMSSSDAARVMRSLANPSDFFNRVLNEIDQEAAKAVAAQITAAAALARGETI